MEQDKTTEYFPQYVHAKEDVNRIIDALLFLTQRRDYELLSLCINWTRHNAFVHYFRRESWMRKVRL